MSVSMCETCPMRGECVGDLEKVRVISKEHIGVEYSNGHAVLSYEQGMSEDPTTIGVTYKDSKGERSEAFKFSGQTEIEAVRNAHNFGKELDACEGPVVSRSLRTFFIAKKICGALVE